MKDQGVYQRAMGTNQDLGEEGQYPFVTLLKENISEKHLTKKVEGKP